MSVDEFDDTRSYVISEEYKASAYGSMMTRFFSHMPSANRRRWIEELATISDGVYREFRLLREELREESRNEPEEASRLEADEQPFSVRDRVNSPTMVHGISMSIALNEWRRNAMPIVQMPATFEAALICTDASAAVLAEEMPWSTFAIHVNSGIRARSGQLIDSLVVSKPGPEFAPVEWDARPAFTMLVFAVGEKTIVFQTPSLAPTDDDLTNANATNVVDWIGAGDNRLVKTLFRLAAGVVLAVNHARGVGRPGSRPSASRRRGESERCTVFQVGEPLKLDLRAEVSSYVSGARGNPLTTKHLRRGHWTHQVHGVGRSLRRLQWIQPCWVGEGPTLVRPVIIGSKETP